MENKKFSISEILNQTSKSSVLKSFSKSKIGIYKKEIFSECQTDKEKKSLRIKLRRKLDQFLGAYLAANKNKPEELKELQQVWQNYAKQIYEDTKIICDNNSDADKQKLVEKFLQAMEK